jgi:large subunit ribosomal protein L32
MGALPKKKVSRSHRGSRRAHQNITLPQLAHRTDCARYNSDCPRYVPTHQTCPVCGLYNGNQVLKDKALVAAE